MIEKTEHMVMLKDFYGPLLTDKQQLVFSLYYENDLSLSEISEEMNISRQAVFDILKRAGNALEDYEKRLNLVEKFLSARSQIEEVSALLAEDKPPDKEVMAKAVNILRRVAEYL